MACCTTLGEAHLNKSELVTAVASDAGLSQADASRAVDSVLSNVANALREGDEARIAGFGTFVVSAREARMGRNPRTGEAIEVQASKSVRFRPAKALKDLVN